MKIVCEINNNVRKLVIYNIWFKWVLLNDCFFSVYDLLVNFFYKGINMIYIRLL